MSEYTTDDQVYPMRRRGRRRELTGHLADARPTVPGFLAIVVPCRCGSAAKLVFTDSPEIRRHVRDA